MLLCVSRGVDGGVQDIWGSRAREPTDKKETKYCMPYPTPVFKQHYMLQELGMACNTWFLVVRARAYSNQLNQQSQPRHD